MLYKKFCTWDLLRRVEIIVSGLGVTAFKFKYFDEPDKDGME